MTEGANMPRITDLPTDTAPDPADIVPFVDVTASRTEAVTVANLAASTAFSATYEPLQLIERTTVTGSPAASIVFADIPQTFQGLEIVVTGEASGSPSLWVRLNGDTGANYASTLVAIRSSTGTGSAAQAEGQTAAIRCGGLGEKGGFVSMQLHGYTRTDTYKNIIAFQSDARNSSPYSFATFGSNVWLSDAAVTSVTVLLNSGNIPVGVTASLYGRV